MKMGMDTIRFAEIVTPWGKVYQRMFCDPDSGYSSYMAGIIRNGGLYLNMDPNITLSFIPYHSMVRVNFLDVPVSDEKMIKYYLRGWISSS